MARLGAPQSKDTLLRSLKRGVNKHAPAAPVHVVGVDDWSWRKGSTYGTIMVDLERREVLDVLPDRSADHQRKAIPEQSRQAVGSRALHEPVPP
jgi:transposase